MRGDVQGITTLVGRRTWKHIGHQVQSLGFSDVYDRHARQKTMPEDDRFMPSVLELSLQFKLCFFY